jgi:hypothetical protein
MGRASRLLYGSALIIWDVTVSGRKHSAIPLTIPAQSRGAPPLTTSTSPGWRSLLGCIRYISNRGPPPGFARLSAAPLRWLTPSSNAGSGKSTGSPSGPTSVSGLIPSNAVPSANLDGASNWAYEEDPAMPGGARGSTVIRQLPSNDDAREFYVNYFARGGKSHISTCLPCVKRAI